MNVCAGSLSVQHIHVKHDPCFQKSDIAVVATTLMSTNIQEQAIKVKYSFRTFQREKLVWTEIIC